jgi:hypothetical protein
VLAHAPKVVVAFYIPATVASSRCINGPAVALLILHYHQLIEVPYATADE